MTQYATPATSYQGRLWIQRDTGVESASPLLAIQRPTEMRKAHWRKLAPIGEFIRCLARQNVLMENCVAPSFCLLILASGTCAIYTKNNLQAPPEACMVYIRGHFPLLVPPPEPQALSLSVLTGQVHLGWATHWKLGQAAFFPSIKLLPLKSSCLNIFLLVKGFDNSHLSFLHQKHTGVIVWKDTIHSGYNPPPQHNLVKQSLVSVWSDWEIKLCLDGFVFTSIWKLNRYRRENLGVIQPCQYLDCPEEAMASYHFEM